MLLLYYGRPRVVRKSVDIWYDPHFANAVQQLYCSGLPLAANNKRSPANVSFWTGAENESVSGMTFLSVFLLRAGAIIVLRHHLDRLNLGGWWTISVLEKRSPTQILIEL